MSKTNVEEIFNSFRGRVYYLGFRFKGNGIRGLCTNLIRDIYEEVDYKYFITLTKEQQINYIANIRNRIIPLKNIDDNIIPTIITEYHNPKKSIIEKYQKESDNKTLIVATIPDTNNKKQLAPIQAQKLKPIQNPKQKPNPKPISNIISSPIDDEEIKQILISLSIKLNKILPECPQEITYKIGDKRLFD